MINPRFPAPVNTYNPTVHAVVDAIFAALSHVVPGRARADGSGSRSIIIGGRSTYAGKGYVQYEILAGGAGGRASKDGGSGITVNQSNAKIAPVEIIESEFPTRLTRFELIEDSGGAGRVPRRAWPAARISQPRRCALFHPLDEAHHPAAWQQRRQGWPHRRHLDQSRHRQRQAAADALRRLSAEGRRQCSGSIRPAAAVSAIRWRAIRRRCCRTWRKAMFRCEAAERDYGVVIDEARRVVDEAATSRRRAAMKAR